MSDNVRDRLVAAGVLDADTPAVVLIDGELAHIETLERPRRRYALCDGDVYLLPTAFGTARDLVAKLPDRADRRRFLVQEGV